MSTWPLAAKPLESRWFGVEELPEALLELRKTLSSEMVVKPRHAACGQGMTILTPTSDEDAMMAALKEAAEVECKRGETWQLYQVTKGVGIEQIYPSVGASIKEPERPLELKLQTMWGRVLGGTIHTSQEIWVTASGRVLRCDNRKSGIRRKYGPIPQWILDGSFESMLKEHWHFLVSESEAIARLWGLDEVRIDWFLGCPLLGPRICEVTWMGTGDRIPPQLQLQVAQAFFAGHRKRAKVTMTDSDQKDGRMELLLHALVMTRSAFFQPRRSKDAQPEDSFLGV
eukprot:symbB.v1.2.035273.t1/scaffold4709.1/size36042/2